MPLRLQQAEQGKSAGVVFLAVLEAEVAAQHQRRIAAGLTGGDRQGRLDPVLPEQQALSRTRTLLVQGIPPVGAQAGADAL